MSPEGQIDQLLQDPRIWYAGGASPAAARAIPTGWPGLDQAFGGGWPVGQLTELLIDASGMGELTLLLPALGRLTASPDDSGEMPSRAALVAPPYIPYAPALTRAGLDLDRLLVVHAKRDTDALWAMEQVLRSQTCAAVVGWSNVSGEAPLRRLQLAAEASGSWAVLFRRAGARLTRSPAPLRIHLTWLPGTGRVRLYILKRRGGPPAMTGVDVG